MSFPTETIDPIIEKVEINKIESDPQIEGEKLADHIESFRNELPFSKKIIIEYIVKIISGTLPISTEDLKEIEELVDDVDNANRLELHKLRVEYTENIKDLDETDEITAESVTSYLYLIQKINQRLAVEYLDIGTNIALFVFLASLSSGGLLLILSLITHKSVEELVRTVLKPLNDRIEAYKIRKNNEPTGFYKHISRHLLTT